MWGQVVTELVEQRGMKVAAACRLFGRCRQAFYQSKADIEQEVKREKLIADTVREIREDAPGIGGYKLWLMLTELYGREQLPERDSFFTLLHRHQLMLPPRKSRHTTNSNHRFHKWKNLTKGMVLTRANQLWVSDITYIQLANGDVGYLHLVTDAYSHKIVGWVLAPSLRAAMSVEALQMAIDQAVEMTGSRCLKGLVHHSDRGVQYCCDAYVEKLQEYGVGISMTEDYNPTDNAIAERINGIIKMENVYRRHVFSDMECAKASIGRYIHFYNNRRPHMSIGYKTPAKAHLEVGIQEKKWKKRKYPSGKKGFPKENVNLPCQT